MRNTYFLKFGCAILCIVLIYLVYKRTKRSYFNPFNELFRKRDKSEKSKISIIEANGGIEIQQYIKGPLQENDPRIVNFIRIQGFIHPPPCPDVPYNLTTPKDFNPSKGQSQVVQKIFKNMTNGFFVECGALDGETRSNTLTLERDFNWTGLLIEGSPSNFELVKTKNRKAWTAKCCLAIHPYPHEVVFRQQFNIGKISSDDAGFVKANEGANEKDNFVPVQCFPIFSLLSAINVTTVDYFSLDVEGHELEVLKTIPFDSVYIKVLSVEFIHVGGGEGPLTKFMKSKNYNVVTKVVAKSNQANDLIFVHKDFHMEGTFP